MIDIETQADAVELSYLSLKNQCEILEDLIRQKKRQPEELTLKLRRVEELEAAVKTMRWLQKNADKIKKLSTG